MAAATGVNIGTISDPQQRGCLSSGLTAAAQGAQQQQRDFTDQTPPTFLVTQSLVTLLTEKSVHCYSPERAEHEANGERRVVSPCAIIHYTVWNLVIHSNSPLLAPV